MLTRDMKLESAISDELEPFTKYPKFIKAIERNPGIRMISLDVHNKY